MGTSGFYSFYGHLFKKIPLNMIENEIIFIDVAIFIYKYVIGIRRKGSDIQTDDGQNISHIYAIKKLVEQFMRLNILPICVFDGKAPEIKNEILEKRREIIDDSIEKCIELKNNDIKENEDEYIKHFKRSFHITKQMINECKQFLDDLGLPYITSITEADPQCAALAHYYQNFTVGTFTEDSDILSYGGNTLLRDLDLSNKTISMIKIEDILSFLQEKANDICKHYNIDNIIITRKNFNDFSIIMGNDYCNGIRCCGGNNRDKLFEIFVVCNCDVKIFVNTLQHLNNDTMKYYIPQQFLEKYEETKDIYKQIEVLDPKLINIQIKKFNYKNINQYITKYKMKESIIKNLIQSIKTVYDTFQPILNEINSYNPINIAKLSDDDWHLVNSKKRKQIVCY